MMKESSYQNKIMKCLEAIGGKVINGTYSKAGEADIQGGYPVNGRLHYIAIEVKTKIDYDRVMRGVKVVDGLYVIFDSTSLKKHESLQIHKINEVRKKNGLALIAFEFKQVEEYVDAKVQS